MATSQWRNSGPGKAASNIETDLKSVKSLIHVMQDNHGSLLSYDTACNIGLVHVRIKHVNDCCYCCGCPCPGPMWTLPTFS